MKSVWITLLLSLGAVVTAQAGVAGWTDAANVKALEANEAGRFTAKLAVEKNTSGCRNADWFYGDYGRPGSELMYRTLLEASLAGLKVQLYVTGACDLKGYSGISSVRILP
ncbi:MAG: hypothetical protein K8I04_09720 [Gammaproteobacteria bacterium]|nr:hypothetical protein [Gammaproteobacteria bacterium]